MITQIGSPIDNHLFYNESRKDKELKSQTWWHISNFMV